MKWLHRQKHLWANVQHHTTLQLKNVLSSHAWKGNLREEEMQKLPLLFHRQGKENSQELDKIQLSIFYLNNLEIYSIFFFFSKLWELWSMRLPSLFSSSHLPFLLQSHVSLKIAEVNFGTYKIQLSFILYPKAFQTEGLYQIYKELQETREQQTK